MLSEFGITWIASDAVPLAPLLSVTVMAKGKLPAAVGVPERIPFAAVSDKPGGNVPDVMDQW